MSVELSCLWKFLLLNVWLVSGIDGDGILIVFMVLKFDKCSCFDVVKSWSIEWFSGFEIGSW